MRALVSFIGVLIVTCTQAALASEIQCFDVAASYASEIARSGLANRYANSDVIVTNISAITPWGMSERFGVVRRMEISGDLSFSGATGKKMSGRFSTRIQIALDSGKCRVVAMGPIEEK